MDSQTSAALASLTNQVTVLTTLVKTLQVTVNSKTPTKDAMNQAIIAQVSTKAVQKQDMQKALKVYMMTAQADSKYALKTDLDKINSIDTFKATLNVQTAQLAGLNSKVLGQGSVIANAIQDLAAFKADIVEETAIATANVSDLMDKVAQFESRLAAIEAYVANAANLPNTVNDSVSAQAQAASDAAGAATAAVANIQSIVDAAVAAALEAQTTANPPA